MNRMASSDPADSLRAKRVSSSVKWRRHPYGRVGTIVPLFLPLEQVAVIALDDRVRALHGAAKKCDAEDRQQQNVLHRGRRVPDDLARSALDRLALWTSGGPPYTTAPRQTDPARRSCRGALFGPATHTVSAERNPLLGFYRRGPWRRWIARRH
jgi:hypothetical protein